MSTRRLLSLLLTGAAVLAATRPSIAGGVLKSPAWISIESPVNPYDAATRGAALIVHTKTVNSMRDGDLTGTAEGLVNGVRRSIPLRIETIASASTYAVRKQWPSEGTWLLRFTLNETTALVTLDAAGNAISARIPMQQTRDIPLPRVVTAKEVDSLLTVAKR